MKIGGGMGRGEEGEGKGGVERVFGIIMQLQNIHVLSTG